MHAKVYRIEDRSCPTVRFHRSGQEKDFDPPEDKSNKRAIRTTLESALDFGERMGASERQLFAIGKALTDAGYHFTKR
jgi:hypothetical protein